MHDHLLANNDDKYNFVNALCNEHIKRYLKKNIDEFPEHKWASKKRELLIKTNKERNGLIDKGINEFDEQKINDIYTQYDQILTEGCKENSGVDLTYVKIKNEERNLIDRLRKFRENHLLFVKDFTVAFTNNTLERGLRQVKRKLAVSFAFKNINRMKDYAIILNYLKTCYRNNILRFDALKRLVNGIPYSVDEIKQISQKVEKSIA